MKKVSIIIPALNEEAYLGKTLAFVHEQKYPNKEIIVVDNGSTDQTQEIAHSYHSVKVIIEKRRGTQFARECGRRIATGDIVAFLDADCEPAPDWLTKGVAHFDNPKVVALAGPYDYHDGGTFTRPLLLFLQRIVYIPVNILLRIFYLGGILVAGNCLVRARALEGIGGLDTSYIFWGDDTNTARRLSRVGTIHFSWNFVMKSSARRLKRDGIMYVIFRYVLAFFKAGFLVRTPTRLP